MRLTKLRGWREFFRRNPAVSAWPFVIVILTQMAVGGISVYTLSTIRAYVTNESLWSKGEHEAIYFLSLYLETENPRHFKNFERAIAVPLAYREARQRLESAHPDVPAVRAALIQAGASPQDVTGLIWMFRNFRGFTYLESSISRWKETDPLILELRALGTSVGAGHPIINDAAIRAHLEQIEAAITPRAIAFSRALEDGARLVEHLLTLANMAFAGLLAALTLWRVGNNLKQRRQIEDALAWQASHDELTGLYNRREFDERLSKTLKLAKDDPHTAHALMFIDLDQFKIVNDTCGHAAGDALLRRICPMLQGLIGPDDLLARFGGDEFSILMPATDMIRALSLAENVRAAIEQMTFRYNDRTFGITASVGIVYEKTGAAVPEDMMSKADMACFMAKEKGRNRVHSHRDEDKELITRMREMNWVQRLHQALNENQFCLYAQEIVPLAGTNDDGIHLEVLIRMRDENGSLVQPSSFLPAAERFGLMKVIDQWVVRQTFRTLAERARREGATPITCCAINLSGRTIGDGAFLTFLREAFAEFSIAPKTICFEVTETSAIVNLDAARNFVRDLRGLGCTFALDDFGSGMSSFNYLKELPVDYLKIDGSFVKNLLTDRSDRAMVEMICHVGHIMGKKIVAEFIETDALADELRDIGVDYGQGFGIAVPKPFNAHFEHEPRALPQIQDRHERLSA